VEDYGIIDDPEHSDAFAADSASLYGSPLDHLVADMDTPAFPYRAAAKALEGTPYVRERGRYIELLASSQRSVGSCVGWGEARKLFLSLAAGVYMRGDEVGLPAQDGAPCMVSPAWCYAASKQVVNKLSRKDGSNGSWAARATAEMGFLFRKEYPDFDARGYSEDICRRWGRSGVPTDSMPYALDQKFRGRVRVNNVEEAVALCQSGYMLNLCNNEKPNDKRDAYGFCRPTGKWSHSETGAICYVVYKMSPTKTLRGLGILNSHGNNRYKGPYGDQTPDLPGGAYIYELNDFQQCLDHQDTWASFDLDGLQPPAKDWEVKANVA
jgi:hypothetical protein